MALSPQNPSITTLQTQEFETTIANALWSILGGGSLSNGSNANRKVFAPAGAGVSTVQAQDSVWLENYAMRNAATDALDFAGTVAAANYRTKDLLRDEGNEVAFTVESNTNPGSVYYTCRNENGFVHYIDRGGNSYYNNAGATFSLGGVAAGDKFKWKLIDVAGNKKLALYKWNGSSWDLKGTGVDNYSLPLTVGNRFYFVGYTPGYAGLSFPSPVTNSPLLATESTNITVTTPGGGGSATERVQFQII